MNKYEEARESQKQREEACPGHVWHEVSDRYVADGGAFGAFFNFGAIARIDVMCAHCGKQEKAELAPEALVASLPPLREGFDVRERPSAADLLKDAVKGDEAPKGAGS